MRFFMAIFIQNFVYFQAPYSKFGDVLHNILLHGFKALSSFSSKLSQ